jgi:rod shape-determining protein MreD
MKKTVTTACGILLCLLLQMTIFHWWRIWGVKPDLVMVWTVLVGLLCGQPAGIAAGVIGGILVDIQVGRFLGLSTATGLLVGWLGGQVGKRAFRDHWFVPVGAVGFCTLVGEAFYLFLGNSFGMLWPLWQAIYLVVIPTAIYNMLVGVLIWPLAKKLLIDEPTYVVWGRG